MSETIDLQLLPNPPDATETYQDIVRKPYNRITYNEFFWNYMNKNWPVILTDVSNNWPCCKEWINPPESTNNGNESNVASINFDYLKKKIGNVKVPVVDCNKEYFNCHEQTELLFYDFLDYWIGKQKSDLIRPNNANLSEDEQSLESYVLFYLKDWHLQSSMSDYQFYKTPIHFSADWLNEFLLETKKDDYRFVYMGPKDSWTPFHADVFCSFSWSTNILGLKKWIILPPGEEQKLKDTLGNLPFRISEKDLDDKNVKYFVLIQKENEALFVPSGWYHQVFNITDTISINHNWFNGCNLLKIWQNLSNEMEKIIKAIDDCKEMENYDSHLQTMLKESFGMNYFDFLDLLEYILEKRLDYCDGNNSNNINCKSYNIFYNLYQPNLTLIQFDLQMLYELSTEMLQNKIIFNDRLVLYRRTLRICELTKYNLNIFENETKNITTLNHQK